MSAPDPNLPHRTPAPGSPEALDAYLDGRLSGPALAAFEERLEGDAELRGEIELQRRIDQVLRRRMSPPERMVIAGLTAETGIGGAGDGRSGPRRLRWLAAAAALALVAAGSWWGWTNWSEGAGPVEALYAQQVALGLKPQWVCGSDAEMAQYLEDQFGQGLVVRAEAGIELVGWTSAPLLSQYTSVLMTRVEGEPVFVLVDKAEAAEPAALSETGSGGLHMFKRELAGLVLYEVTPREGPVLLDRFTAEE